MDSIRIALPTIVKSLDAERYHGAGAGEAAPMLGGATRSILPEQNTFFTRSTAVLVLLNVVCTQLQAVIGAWQCARGSEETADTGYGKAVSLKYGVDLYA